MLRLKTFEDPSRSERRFRFRRQNQARREPIFDHMTCAQVNLLIVPFDDSLIWHWGRAFRGKHKKAKASSRAAIVPHQLSCHPKSRRRPRSSPSRSVSFCPPSCSFWLIMTEGGRGRRGTTASRRPSRLLQQKIRGALPRHTESLAAAMLDTTLDMDIGGIELEQGEAGLCLLWSPCRQDQRIRRVSLTCGIVPMSSRG